MREISIWPIRYIDAAVEIAGMEHETSLRRDGNCSHRVSGLLSLGKTSFTAP